MDDKEIDDKKVKKTRVSLKNIDQILAYMAKKVREFENDIERAKRISEYRTRFFMVGKMIDGVKVQKDLLMEKRMIAIEKILGVNQ